MRHSPQSDSLLAKNQHQQDNQKKKIFKSSNVFSQVQECCNSLEIYMSHEDPYVIALIIAMSMKEKVIRPDTPSQVPGK